MSKTLIICVALALATALTASLALASTPAPRTVKVGDNWFYQPSGVKTLNVYRNTTIRFRWLHATPHDVVGYRGSTSGTPKFESPIKNEVGDVYRKKMTQTGTFTIICSIHDGAGDVQRIRIKVKP